LSSFPSLRRESQLYDFISTTIRLILAEGTELYICEQRFEYNWFLAAISAFVALFSGFETFRKEIFSSLERLQSWMLSHQIATTTISRVSYLKERLQTNSMIPFTILIRPSVLHEQKNEKNYEELIFQFDKLIKEFIELKNGLNLNMDIET